MPLENNGAYEKHEQNVRMVIDFLVNYGFNIRNIDKEVMDLTRGQHKDEYLSIWKKRGDPGWGAFPSKERIEMKVGGDFNKFGDFILLGANEFPVRVLGGIFISKKSIDEARNTKFVVVVNASDVSKSKVFKMKAIQNYLSSIKRAGAELPKRFEKEGVYLSRMKNFITLDQFAVNLVKIKVTCTGERGDNRKIEAINKDFNKTIPKPVKYSRH